MKLAVKIVLVGLLMIFLVIGTTLLISVNSLQNALEQEIGLSQQLLAESTVGEIDRVLFGALQDIRIIADATPIENLLLARNTPTSSIEIARLDKIATQRLDELLISSGPWYDLQLFDVEGNYVLDALDNQHGDTIQAHSNAENTAFSEILLGQPFYISEVIVDAGRATMIYAAPIRDSTGSGQRVIGVVIGKFAWPLVDELLQNIGVTAHLFNKEGFLISSSDFTKKDQIFVTKASEVSTAFEHSSEINSISIIAEVPGTTATGHTVDEVLTSRVVQQGYLLYKGHNWVLLLETPTTIAFSSITKIIKNLLLSGFILMLLTVVLILLFAQNITAPIKRLKNAAQKISRGNFSDTIVSNSNDEIGELAQSFDDMRYSLKMVIDEYDRVKSKENSNRKSKKLEEKKAKTIKN